MDLLENPITTHKNARWFAVIAYLLGMALIGIGYLLSWWWSWIIMAAGLVVWYVPVAWCAYKWSQGGNK